MAYSTTSFSFPFWAKSADFIRGRDPLGIQNSSIALYSKLLPGMTNLTLRLRYYGFYLWVLDEYDLLPSDNIFKESARGEYNFIRRAELILAYFMANKHPEEQSVIGINFAVKKQSEYEILGYYDIALGADKFSNTIKGSVYWDYSSGAFGQYYFGSLSSLKLVEAKSGSFFARTEEGLELANAYRNSVPAEQRNLFVHRILEGKLYIADLENLTDFALNKNLNDTEEKEFYLKMLLDRDGENFVKMTGEITFQRKESISLFLNFLDNEADHETFRDFPKFIYTHLKSEDLGNIEDAHFGWYYYYLNELVHYGLETLFWGMLVDMSKKSRTVKDFINQIVDHVFEMQNEIMLDRYITFDDVLKIVSTNQKETAEYIKNISQDVKNKQHLSAIHEAIFLLIHLHLENKENDQFTRDYAQCYDLQGKNGNALNFFGKFFTRKEDSLFSEFISELLKNLVNEHTFIAYRKMGNGEKNLLKFFVEDNYLIHIETMEPNFTSPRLRTLFNFLVDLNLISKEGKPNEEALLLMN